MTKINVSLTCNTYSSNISTYLISRLAFKVVANILLILIIFATVLKITHHLSVPAFAIVVWAILWGMYIFLMPYLIKIQSTKIYNNTLFLHNEMSFEFTNESITWTTSAGTRSFPMDNIYKIATTSTALVVSFSRYQVLPLPYSNISPEDWQQLTSLIKNLNSKSYHKFQKRTTNANN